MKKLYNPIVLLSALCFTSLALCGCDHTFFGTIMLLRFQDIVKYVGFALFFGVLAAFLQSSSPRTGFWFSFLLSLGLTPIAGLIYCLILLTRRS